MKITLVLLVLILISALCGCAIENTPEMVAEYEVLFNQYRVDHGEKPLIFKDDLNKVAALRVEEVKKDYSHNSAGHYTKRLAENIINNVNNNAMAIRWWDKSLGHQYNMLNSEYLYTGYSISHGYAVQVFSSYPTIDGVPQLPEGYHWPGE